jgi:rare lipoprotein A
MRPMTMTRARLTAGATAVCATLAVVPAAASPGATAATAAPVAAKSPAAPGITGVRKRTQASVWVRHVRRNIVVGHTALVSGKLQPGLKGHVVRLQRRTPKGWATIDRALTRVGGAFRFSFTPRSIGTLNLRVQFPGDKGARKARRAAGRLNVFRHAHASWYSLYGNRTACGQTLGYGTLGVAHKALPCGTKLTLRYRGRSVRVRVIDRGPFVAGREFDLTAATKRTLDFGDLGTVLVNR